MTVKIIKVYSLNKYHNVILDEKVYSELSKRPHTITINSKYSRYARIYFKDTGKRCLLHRWVTNCPKHLTVDHINKNKLDNRLHNLECVSREENTRRAKK